LYYILYTQGKIFEVSKNLARYRSKNNFVWTKIILDQNNYAGRDLFLDLCVTNFLDTSTRSFFLYANYTRNNIIYMKIAF